VDYAHVMKRDDDPGDPNEDIWAGLVHLPSCVDRLRAEARKRGVLARDIDDVLHLAILSIANSKSRPDPADKGACCAWLMTLMHYAILRYLRDRRRSREELAPATDAFPEPVALDDPERWVAAKRLIERVFPLLREEYQDALLWAALGEGTLADLARKCGVPEPTARVWVSRGRDALQALVDAEEARHREEHASALALLLGLLRLVGEREPVHVRTGQRSFLRGPFSFIQAAAAAGVVLVIVGFASDTLGHGQSALLPAPAPDRSSVSVAVAAVTPPSANASSPRAPAPRQATAVGRPWDPTLAIRARNATEHGEQGAARGMLAEDARLRPDQAERRTRQLLQAGVGGREARE
jgi:RNA polymerase sigma factor (sigma-70 family)